LLVKIKIDNSHCSHITRVGDDLHYSLEINLIDAIFGTQLRIKTIDNKDEVLNILPGWQSDEKLIFQNRVRLINNIKKKIILLYF
jgi:DnaJ-class molecular chaperone